MERLLKIVEGPMKGAEIALVAGTRIKVGSGDACDVIVSDSSMPDVAFELDVAEDAVTLVGASGETEVLPDFEMREFGETAVAVGPAEGAWGELRRKPAPEAEKPEAEPAEEKPAEKPAEKPVAASEGKRSRGGLVAGVVVILLILLAAAAAWFWWFRLRPAREAAAEPVVTKTVSLDDIAAEHGLVLTNDGEQVKLIGNFRRRTERLAVRALALAADRSVKLDLTDDQSLKSAVDSALSLATEGRLTVVDVTNRVAEIVGAASNPSEVAEVMRMLRADVPQLTSCRVDGVRLPVVETRPAPTAQKAPAKKAAVLPVAAPARRSSPQMAAIAGILTVPYPCVVLADGSRCLEGARIGSAVLKKIEADRLVLGDGNSEFEWKP